MGATKLKMSEKQLQQTVIDAARRMGYRCAHFPRSQNARGQWLTTVAADAKGFPDLVLVGKRKIVFVECKSDTGTLSAEQYEWKWALAAVGACYLIVKPKTLDTTLETLKEWS